LKADAQELAPAHPPLAHSKIASGLREFCADAQELVIGYGLWVIRTNSQQPKNGYG
jgi:hypothetical protein